jgi:DNA replication protein DnaC
MVEGKDYLRKMFEFAQESEKAAKKRCFDSKYKCVICGKDGLTFTDVQNMGHFRSNAGVTEYVDLKWDENQQLKPDTMIVCSEPCRRAYVASDRIPYGALMEGTNIPLKYQDARLSWWNVAGSTKAYDNILKWLEAPEQGFYFYGPPGSGKSSFAAAVAYEVRKQEGTVYFIKGSALALLCNATMFAEDVAALLARFSRYDVLILDDMSNSHHLTAHGKQLMFELFSNAYDNGKIVIVTSNTDPDKVAGSIDERLASRFAEMLKAVHLNRPDQRRNGEGINTSK